MKEPWKGFVFLDVSEDLLREVHNLGHGLTLRKANLDEINQSDVKHSFRFWSERRGTSSFLNQRMPLADGQPQGSVIPNPDLWRHAVIECTNPDVFFWNVNLAFSLSKSDLRIGLVRFDSGAVSSPYLDFSMLNVRNSLGAMFVDHELPALKDLNKLIQDIDYVIPNINNNFPNEIKEVIHIFSSLDNLPDSSTLKVLGYFSVIEGLLSHPPLPDDRVDSIQRQLIRNVNLLNNRLKKIEREINFSAFGETKLKKVLGSLYGYRSAIAHGGRIESSLKEIDRIRPGSEKTDHLWVHDWLREMLKGIILASIIESELVMDLK
jgi:hypothetical protein